MSVQKLALQSSTCVVIRDMPPTKVQLFVTASAVTRQFRKASKRHILAIATTEHPKGSVPVGNRQRSGPALNVSVILRLNLCAFSGWPMPSIKRQNNAKFDRTSRATVSPISYYHTGDSERIVIKRVCSSTVFSLVAHSPQSIKVRLFL